MQFVFGFLLILLGALEIWKTDWLIRNFGYIDWAERKIGNGGTWTFHKALGVILIISAFIVGSGQYLDVLDWIFNR